MRSRTEIKRGLLIPALVALSQFATAADTVSPDQRLETVRQFLVAFNAHDTEAMLRMVTDDVQWLSVDGESIHLETGSKDALRAGMTEYFESCPSCKSRLGHHFATGARVTALEIASNETSKGLREQQSISVYEFSGALIRRVYYFPAERVEKPAPP